MTDSAKSISISEEESPKAKTKEPVGTQPGSDAEKKAQKATWLKTFVLVFLVAQNSSASLLMRLSRSGEGAQWNPQSGVIIQEVMKALACVVLCGFEGTLFSVFSNRSEALKTSVPALLYLVQNNLQYLAVTHLDASTYAVLYQLKIITTALLSVVILSKKLTGGQWVALTLLTAGVSIVVLAQVSPADKKEVGSSQLFLGMFAVLAACFTSGLAGVSFEYLLKGSTMSLWTRNLQLALYSMAIGICGYYGTGGNSAVKTEKGAHGASFFHGFTMWTWLSVLNNAFGGLLIAVVIKYADNILKNFSTSLSIILTATVSVLALDSAVDMMFACGTAMVIYAVFLYGAVNPLGFITRLLHLQESPPSEQAAQTTSGRDANESSKG